MSCIAVIKAARRSCLPLDARLLVLYDPFPREMLPGPTRRRDVSSIHVREFATHGEEHDNAHS